MVTPRIRVLAFGGLGNRQSYFEPLVLACANDMEFNAVDIHDLTPACINARVAEFFSLESRASVVVLGFSSSCYATAKAFDTHKTPGSRLLLIDPPYILGPGELPDLKGLHPYYRDPTKRAETLSETRTHVRCVLSPSLVHRMFFRLLNVCPPLQWCLRLFGSRTPWEVDRVIFSMPIRDLQDFLGRFILAYDPVQTVESLDPRRTCVMSTMYSLSRKFMEARKGPVSQCVCYTDTGHHVIQTHPELVRSTLIALCATSTP